MALEPGTRVGKYEIEALVGEGGMGRVYRALDTELHRPAALKFLPAEFAADARRMSRFEKEARTASALNHPNIVTVYDIGQTADGRRFFATEFVEGVTLREHVLAQRPKLGGVLELATQVASALVEAHGQGVVHRDIKPENVMVRRDRIVKVLDFGLAKLTGSPASGVDTEAATRSLVVTDAGAVMGTVSYMSPEQSRGEEVDARTDVWSLGVVLYEMLTGHTPFRGKSSSHTLVAIQDEEPPPLSVYLPEVPDLLQEVVSDALAKDREARLTAKQMLAKLQRLKRRLDSGAHLDHSVAPDASTPSGEVSGRATASSLPGTTASGAHSTLAAAPETQTSDSGARARAPGVRRAWPAVALGVVLLAGLGFGLYKFFARGRAGAAPPISSLQEMKFTKLPVGGGTVVHAISPDGKLIAYMAAYKDDEGVYLTVEAADVSARTTKEVSPVKWRSRGFAPLAWLSDGSGLIVAGVSRTSPPNTRLQLWHVSYPGGELYQITNDPNGYPSVGLTADSRTLLTSQTTGFSNVWVVPSADPARAAQVTNSTAPIHQLAWTPDGRIVYASRASGNPDLWVMNADGTGNRQLTFNPENDFAPAASPDGRYIIFQSVRDRVNSLYRMNADGSGAKEIARNMDTQVYPQVSRDSQWVYYTPTDPATGKIVLMRVSMEGGEPSKLREGVIFNRLSPDGEHFLAWKQGGGVPNAPQQLVVYPASGGEPVRTLDAPPGTQTFVWSPDGQAVDFIATRDGVTNVWRQPLAGGKPRQVTAWKTDAPLTWLAWSFDGRSLAVVRDTSNTDLVLVQNFR